MKRRHFLAGLAALSAGCAPTDRSGSGPDVRDPRDLGETGLDTGEAGPEVSLAETGPALERRVPSSLATASGEDQDLSLKVLSGELPTDLVGHSFVVHAVPYGDGSSLFLGDGRVCRIDWSDRGFKARIQKTPCYYADHALEGHWAGFENKGLARFSMTLGARNHANTALQPMGDRLLVTYDAGRPHEIDPHSLELVTPVGYTHEWPAMMPEWLTGLMNWPFAMIMSTAHPGYDHETGELFTVAFALAMMSSSSLDIVRWDGEGALRTWRVVDEAGDEVEILQAIHQIVVTRSAILVVDTSFLLELDSMFQDDVPAQAQAPDSVCYLILRDDLVSGSDTVTCRKLVLPRETVHFYADFDDSAGMVLHMAHNTASDPSEFLKSGDVRADNGEAVRSDLYGLPVGSTDIGQAARYVIDLATAEVVESDLVEDDTFTWGGPALATWKDSHRTPDRYEDLFWCGVGFSEELNVERIQELYADHPHRSVAIEDLPTEGRPSSLFRVEVDGPGVADGYAFPDGRVGLSPMYVPRSGGGGCVAVVVTSDDRSTAGSSGDEIWVFDAENLAQGPLARLGHEDLDLPFTLHTTWMESVKPREATYAVDIREDLGEAVAAQMWDIQAVFEDEVYPNFE